MEKVKSQKGLPDSILYLLTPPHIIDPDILIPMVVQAVRSGADIIQFRNKEATTRELIEVGAKLSDVVHAEGAIFLVNDRVDIAIATDADGVHLGQNDLHSSWARRILGVRKKWIIGISTHSWDQAIKAEYDGADYIGFGPIYPTWAKSDDLPIGTDFFQRLNETLKIPYFAIGGIDLHHVEHVIKAGASRIAMCNGVFGQKDIAAATAQIKKQLLALSPKGRPL